MCIFSSTSSQQARRSYTKGKSGHWRPGKCDASSYIYRRIYPDRVDEKGLPIQDKLGRSKSKLSAYNGTEIHQFGLVSFPCRYKENWVETDFYVVDTNSPAILGLSSSRQMKLISLNCAVRSEPERHISDKRDLQTKYPDRFEGIGKFPGKHHLVV